MCKIVGTLLFTHTCEIIYGLFFSITVRGTQLLHKTGFNFTENILKILK